MKRVWMFAVMAMLIAAVPVAVAAGRAQERPLLKLWQPMDDPETLREFIPESYSEAERSIEASSLEPRRFLLWTNDLQHVMWGRLANGFFAGEDNHGVRVWGAYGKNALAGLYGGEPFEGAYRAGRWKAEGLFGEESARGRYLVYPGPTPAPRPVPVPEPEPAALAQ